MAERQTPESDQRRPFVPGYEQPCNGCPFRDFYMTWKNNESLIIQAQQRQTLVQNLQRELQAATDKLEEQGKLSSQEG